MSQYQGTQKFTPAAADTAWHILASATTRAGVTEFGVSSNATPVEQSGDYRVVRTTTTGTTPAGSTTVTKRDSFSPSAGCTFGGGGYTTEPTVGDVLYDFAVHQKTTYRWVAYPGREFMSSPAASAGIALVVVGQSAAYSISTPVCWIE